MLAKLLRRHYFLPAEHGAWIWWIGPLMIGLAAGQRVTRHAFVLALVMLALFLLRQPTAIAVKAISGRRARADLLPAAAWATLELLAAAFGVWVLLRAGYAKILQLAPPAIAVFGWHLWLTSRRAERGNRGIELVGAGVLSLAAPAAYWVAEGPSVLEPWILWLITWLQSAASIVSVFLRLEQRRLTQMPEPAARWRMGARSLAYHVFNVVLSAALASTGLVPWMVPAAFLLMLIDAVQGVAHPPVGARPGAIGLRQLGVSLAFVLLMVLAYRG